VTRVVWLGSLVLGLALMLGFEDALTRVLGMLCLAVFVVLGVALVARPAFLADEEAAERADAP
jgi:hypothetical protein